MSFSAITAITIFVLVYMVLITERINKTILVLAGASIFMLFRLIPFKNAIHHIDMNVILLLLGMMIIVKVSEKSGIFEYIAVWSAKKVKGDPKKMLVMLFIITAFFSAILDNVTTILLISPVSLLLASQLNISPLPFLISEIIASNVGGTATLIGDPPNIMIGSAANLDFMDFVVTLSPVIIFQSVVMIFLFILIFKKDLRVDFISKKRILEIDEKDLIRDSKLLKKSLTVITFVVAGFLMHGFLHVEASVIALLGASVLVIWTGAETDELLERVEWGTILFFIGLFIMVGGLEYTGCIKKIAEQIIGKTQGNVELASTYIMFFTGITSGILDNIPLVATFIPIIKIIGQNIGEMQVLPVWWSLSLGACLGGNGTLIGASANVIMMNFAKRNNVDLSFKRYMLYGIPFTFLSLVISYLYLMMRFFW